MNHLTNDDKERLLSQMKNVAYVTSYEIMQHNRSMYQVKNRQPRKMLKIRNCYCEKNLRDCFFRYVSYKIFGSVNATPFDAKPCCNIENFLAGKQPEIFREIDEFSIKHKSINNIQELINDESINKIFLRLSYELEKQCVRCDEKCKLSMISTSGINNIVF